MNLYSLPVAATFDRSILEMALNAPEMREGLDAGSVFGEDPYLTEIFRESAERRMKIPARPLDGDTVRGIMGHFVTGGMVLLKNSKRLLPFTSQLLQTLAVIGPMADGGIIEGLKHAAPGHMQLVFAKGCPPGGTFSDELLACALSTAVRADAIALCLGVDDGISPHLPAPQLALLEALVMLGKPVAAVIFGPRPHFLENVHKKADSVLLAWRRTEYHGPSLGHVLFGHVNPSGRMPITLPRSDDSDDSSNSSYLYMRQEPLYPFGYGLSYTRFTYGGLKLSVSRAAPRQEVSAECVIENAGVLPGHEAAQMYLRYEGSRDPHRPRWSLCGIERVFLNPGQSRSVEFKLPRLAEKGRYVVYTGGHQPDARSVWLSETPVLSAFLEVE